MDERTMLGLLADRLPRAGDDAAVIDGLVVTIDMLHETTDFPPGTTRYTAGWRAVGASLSDVAAMGAEPTAAVAVYGAPVFEQAEILAFVDGARDVCEGAGSEYVGGDLDSHEEFTVSTAAVGRTDDPVLRSGARPGDAICVTGTLGRSAGAVRLFERGELERANELFRFEPRIEAGRALAPYASAMMDSSDGLARSLHQLAEASACGMAVETPLPVDDVVDSVAGPDERLELGAFFGEDFELVCTIPEPHLPKAKSATPTPLTRIGTVVEEGITLDGEPMPDRGYTHQG
ncbi:thiamine-phosphate kinase [Halapricum hydrolyticum]|uniref:Thiamine-monophosphate kinase n=1 Tax=Halapricum hydrolyticum TaxID=2979991 RepID=A0AAE3IES2_9EURY|nr:thiamine-phosphate kinase [Halapricum hydrolyticum]MCU4718288.1 thiamine-phosphate kinase [Halapricum hydrolyticum]MCU4727264.1 thiamine-phosphate kinase [Halapricum hydrolyticum]